MKKNKYLLLLLLFSVTTLSFAQSIDTLYLKNGDRLIGEIKEMNKGVLTIETDYSDSDFKVEYKEIDHLECGQAFLISLSDGRTLKATKLYTDPEKESLHIVTETQKLLVNVNDIVYIRPVKKGFMSRLDASISVGFNYTKASELKQLTVRSTLGYTADYWSLSGAYNSVRSNQSNTDEIHRTDANVVFKYFFKKNKYLLYSAEYLANSEQEIDIRLTNKLGVGNYFVHNNRMYFALGAGAAWNKEDYFNNENNRNSAELFGAAELNIFDFEDFSLLSSLYVYPSLSESKRIRTDFKIDLKYDLPLDIFIKLGLTYNYDSKPVENTSKDDYVLQTTLGWDL